MELLKLENERLKNQNQMLLSNSTKSKVSPQIEKIEEQYKEDLLQLTNDVFYFS